MKETLAVVERRRPRALPSLEKLEICSTISASGICSCGGRELARRGSWTFRSNAVRCLALATRLHPAFASSRKAMIEGLPTGV